MGANTLENPAAALEALTAPPSRRVGRFEVRTLTLGLHAVLQRIASPLVTPGAEPTMEAWAETLFAMTRPGRESARLLADGREAFRAAALDWADAVSEEEGAELIRAAADALLSAGRANPAPDETGGDEEDDGAPEGADPTAATRTAGSPTARPRPANGSGGPSTK